MRQRYFFFLLPHTLWVVTPKTLAQVATLVGLAATTASVGARLAVTRDRTPADLVTQASTGATRGSARSDDVARLQHLSMALALLHAARAPRPTPSWSARRTWRGAHDAQRGDGAVARARVSLRRAYQGSARERPPRST